jgi:hypothetical protein
MGGLTTNNSLTTSSVNFISREEQKHDRKEQQLDDNDSTYVDEDEEQKYHDSDSASSDNELNSEPNLSPPVQEFQSDQSDSLREDWSDSETVPLSRRLHYLENKQSEHIPSSSLSMLRSPSSQKYHAALIATTDSSPKSFKAAMQRSDSEMWKHAAKSEMQSIKQNKTWTLTDLPSGRQAIGCKWVFALKLKQTAVLIDTRLDL